MASSVTGVPWPTAMAAGANPAERAPRREGTNEGMDADRLAVVGEEVADGAEHVRRDEEPAVGEPEGRLVPAGEADDAAGLDAGGSGPTTGTR